MLRMLRERERGGGEGGRKEGKERDRDHMITIMIAYNIMFIVTNLFCSFVLLPSPVNTSSMVHTQEQQTREHHQRMVNLLESNYTTGIYANH